MITISLTIFICSQIFANIDGLEKLNAEFALNQGHGNVITWKNIPFPNIYITVNWLTKQHLKYHYIKLGKLWMKFHGVNYWYLHHLYLFDWFFSWLQIPGFSVWHNVHDALVCPTIHWIWPECRFFEFSLRVTRNGKI